MNRAMRRIAKSKRGGKRYMQSSREANSAQARGITKEQLESMGFTPVTPNKLVELTFEADRVLIY